MRPRSSPDNVGEERKPHWREQGRPSPVNCLLKSFWDLESIGITPTGQQHLTSEDNFAWDKVKSFFNRIYLITCRWQRKRLVCIEWKLIKDKEIAVAYYQVLNDYLDIRRVPDEEPMPECQWLLPHFPVVRPEKATCKVRIVFKGSVPFEGKSLNTEVLTGQKLQSDIFEILVKLRKEWVALVGDNSQMYHQLVLLQEDRPMYRFLWRNMKINKELVVYEFLRVWWMLLPFLCLICLAVARRIPSRYLPSSSGCGRKNHCYMDDLMLSLDSVEKAI